jgi:signal transduction histidine kinase/DNA-binding response OmpR family regulator
MSDERSLRVLVLAPTEADAELTRSILSSARLACDVCRDLDAVAAEFASGAGAIVLTEEVFATDDSRKLVAAIASQPEWSDIPVVLLAGSSADATSRAMAHLGNVTVLERPVRITTLTSTLGAAIAARRRQYLLRDRIAELTRTETSLRNLTHRLRLLLRAAALLLSSEQPAQTMGTLFSHIAPHFDLHAYVYMSVEGGDSMRLVSCGGIEPGAASAITRLDGSADPLAPLMRAHGMRANMFFPLIADGRLLGVLSFATRSRDRFDEQEQGFLRTIAHYVTIASERAALMDELRETDRRKDEFLATLAHELRNPLAPIRNALHIMRLDADETTIAQAHAMMERQLGHMVRLIDDLLDLSRITRGKLELRKEPVDLAAVIANAVETARPLIEAAGHELSVSLATAVGPIEADAVRLAQVVSNLLSNAAKYTDRGGRIVLTTRRGEREVAISVRDSGIGIPPESLPTVFDMFMQVDRSSDRSQGGLGIGLTLVKNLVEMHGGRVEAKSDGAGKGSEFIVHLPFASAATTPAVARESASPGKETSGCRRVLVADDNADAAFSMAAMLRLMGHDVRIVRNGAHALEEAARFRPDVALLDIGMPVMNGYEVARRIRRERWGGAVVLAALTGWGQDEDKRRAAEAGFDAHFTKPVDPNDIETLIARLAGGRHAAAAVPPHGVGGSRRQASA